MLIPPAPEPFGAPVGGEHGGTMTNEAPQAALSRLPLVDAARGVALLAMASYHLSWDLDFFAFTDWGVGSAARWKAYAETIAASFLLLVGVSLALAHQRSFRTRSFARRLAILALAAGAVTLATGLATPDGTVWFGVLHCIAVSSVVASPFLRWPVWAAALAAGACFAAPAAFASPAWDGLAWIWTGLATDPPRTNDYVPMLPWTGFVLAGLAMMRLALARPAVASGLRPPVPAALAFIGRHSLAFYLAHQPLLFGALWLALQALGPSERVETARFSRSCVASCAQPSAENAVCAEFCGCVADAAKHDALWRPIQSGALTPEQLTRYRGVIAVCRR